MSRKNYLVAIDFQPTFPDHFPMPAEMVHRLVFNIIEKLLQGLKELSKTHTREEIAELCKTSQETIVRIMNRKRGFPEKFSLNMALKIWEGLGNPPETLLCPEPLQPIITIVGELPKVPAWVRPQEYLAVPLVEGRIAAGTGRIVAEDITDLVWVYKPELGGRRNLVAVKLSPNAHSMEPSIKAGSIVIIDHSDRVLSPAGIYAVRTDADACAIKRVRIHQGKFVLLSDNPEYPPEISDFTDIDSLLVGRVIWSWTSWLK